MKAFLSPWIHELERTRLWNEVAFSQKKSVVVLGGGIAGVMTAYFLLKNTRKKVSLVEAFKIAHGATGHNAGQVVSYFESSFADLVKKHGLELATRAQADILSAWDLLQSLHEDLKLKTPLHIFEGYSGYVEEEELFSILENRYFLRKAGLLTEEVCVRADLFIPEKYEGLYARVPVGFLMDKLQTKNSSYIAMTVAKKAVLNSAKLCEEMVEKMLERWPERFEVMEHSKVDRVDLYSSKVKLLFEKKFVWEAKQLILCTNGYENFDMVNHAGQDINESFHEVVRGVIGYMAGYLEEPRHEAMAISYHRGGLVSDAEIKPYFYLTRRPYMHGKSLVTLGGPELEIPDSRAYSRDEHEYPDPAHADLDAFLREDYIFAPKHIHYEFFWHGLMGYTDTNLRKIGPDPHCANLFYNLGCNGVGILSSIFGGFKVAKQAHGQKFYPSLFDPK